VRQWYTGYARPDIEKIPAICKFYGVSADWLLGISETQAVDIEVRDICKKTGLSENALYNLIRYNNEENKDKSPKSAQAALAVEKLWLINHLIDDTDFTDTLAENVNMYVNMRNAVENFEIPSYDGYSAIEITKLGLERLGITFNFTQGKQTADFYAFQCQQDFIAFIENISMPAYFLKGWESEERQRSEPSPDAVALMDEFLEIVHTETVKR
jgi:transcriptional regulator with XRE-family HTH domain